MKNSVFRNLSYLFIFVISNLILKAQENAAYILYNNKGEKIDYEHVLKVAGQQEVIFFGELHNNPISHWLQLKLTEDLYVLKKGKIILGAEMFETDDQLVIDEYLNGHINVKNFEEEVKLWKNYTTDYKPLMEFAKSKKVSFKATNVPRRYANLVFRLGLEGLNNLDPMAKNQFLPPLPFPLDMELPTYKKMISMMGNHGGNSSDNMVKSQALKDATMGFSISRAIKEDHLFIHFNGAYHSDEKEGTVWFLNKYKPNLKTLNITTVEQAKVDVLDPENYTKADFILVVSEKMTKTY
ncbi:MAG: hypothetical protein RLZZ417_2633 [Bacteroidota bacterium]|jgi:uncharacterized iron-regulated protein